jgi:uncharacterized 2Fe-2S/4Fe-4S cluster protein (DUF4445 family)
MPKLTVIKDDTTREISFSQGYSSSVLEILDATDLRVRCGCQGNGACGLCLVQIISGNINSPTKNERLTLTPGQLGRNIRLACQLIPEKDLRIRIINTASASCWRDLGHIPCTPAHLHPNAGKGYAKSAYGLAVDLGTTHISLSLWDLKHGRRISGRVGPNPQACYGADVVTRLIAAEQSSENARRLSRMALDAIHEALLDICSRNGVGPGDVVQVTIVGNTPMLVLLTETDPRPLLEPRSWTRPIHCRPDETRAWAQILGIDPEAAVYITSPLAGFVGSDLLAGVVATRLIDHPGGLLIDFGTNSEMALWDGRTLWVTSAAGGPAFESFHTQCGMPAEAGAVCSIDMRQNPTELDFRVIGGGEAKGLCGSGLVDLIAILRNRGDLTHTGNFATPHSGDGFAVKGNGHTIRLTKRDVDTFQRAKAAIGVGIITLLAKARMSASKLSRICVSGAFGQNLNIRNAQAVGLLPEAPSDRVQLCGNTALAGCERLLFSPTGSAELGSLRERATVLNLSQSSDLETLFLENLYLRPLKVNMP